MGGLGVLGGDGLEVRGEGWGWGVRGERWGVSLTDVDLDSHIRDKRTSYNLT